MRGSVRFLVAAFTVVALAGCGPAAASSEDIQNQNLESCKTIVVLDCGVRYIQEGWTEEQYQACLDAGFAECEEKYGGGN